jgi:hypothetical protein
MIMVLNNLYKNFRIKTAKLAIYKLQKDYLKKFGSELPVLYRSGQVESRIENNFIKTLFEANDWRVYEESDLFFAKPDTQKNSILIRYGGDDSKSSEVDAIRGPKFLLKVMDKYTFDDRYLWPKSITKIVPILENLQTKYHLDKVSLQCVIDKVDLPPHTFEKVKGRMDTTIIDNTFDTDLTTLNHFLDTFEEVVQIYAHADFDSPEYQNSMVVPPKHTLLLGDIETLGDDSKEMHTKILDRLKACSDQYADYLDGIYLIGDLWLACDEQGFAKKDGNISYIRYANKTFKVVEKSSDLDALLDDDLIRPHSWFWIKGSQKLTELRFRLTK